MNEEALKEAEIKLLDYLIKHKHITTEYKGYHIDITATKTNYAKKLYKAVT